MAVKYLGKRYGITDVNKQKSGKINDRIFFRQRLGGTR